MWYRGHGRVDTKSVHMKFERNGLLISEIERNSNPIHTQLSHRCAYDSIEFTAEYHCIFYDCAFKHYHIKAEPKHV